MQDPKKTAELVACKTCVHNREYNEGCNLPFKQENDCLIRSKPKKNYLHSFVYKHWAPKEDKMKIQVAVYQFSNGNQGGYPYQFTIEVEANFKQMILRSSSGCCTPILKEQNVIAFEEYEIRKSYACNGSPKKKPETEYQILLASSDTDRLLYLKQFQIKEEISSCDGKIVEIDGKKYKLTEVE